VGVQFYGGNSGLQIPIIPGRPDRVQQAIHLEYFTIIYNIAEGLVSVVLGGVANSVALIGFGLDSFVESLSGLIVLWRFRSEAQGDGEYATLESHALRYVGWSFFLLSAYIVVESIRKLWLQEQPEPSPLGILLAVLSLIIMPLLARKKYRTGKALDSAAMVGDSKQTLACSLLSVALLLGLSLNAAFDWWWADPIAGLAMVPWLLKEGHEALLGKACCD
jgi:divalent metal cation (Fe/Co/Zn/Cd) transporter